MQRDPRSERPAKVEAPPPAIAQSVPPPPTSGAGLLAWAETYGVSGHLDRPFLSLADRANTYYLPHWFDHPDEVLTYRRVLLDGKGSQAEALRYYGLQERARNRLHKMAKRLASHRAARSWMEANGRDPADELLLSFLKFLREQQSTLTRGPSRRPEDYTPLKVVVVSSPVPALIYSERSSDMLSHFVEDDSVEVSLALLGWNERPARWSTRINGVGWEAQEEGPRTTPVPSAAEAMIDFLRDPRRAHDHEALSELLATPPWRFALGELDRQLTALEGGGEGGNRGRAESVNVAPGQTAAESRVGFRLSAAPGGGLLVEPVVQKRQRNGMFSRGSRLDWHHLRNRTDLTPADQRVFRAFADPFAGGAGAVSGLTGERLFGILGALIDHPAVSWENAGSDLRPDIRQGRLRLRFVSGADGGLLPQFELAGHALLPEEVTQSLSDDGHLIHVARPEGQPPQVLLARVSRPASALMRALGTAPGRFPMEAHDALATRLESLQSAMDIEFPTVWTRSIGDADPRCVVRLELLVSGALQARLAFRPVKQGATFSPGEGPTLLLEGEGRNRHGVRRVPQEERQTARTLADRLELTVTATEVDPWTWRVPEGDAAMRVVEILKELGDSVVVEWADDAGLFSLGSVGRGDMRMQVADRRDWFGVDGGAEVKTGGGKEVVPLAQLFAAIREGRRYVTVGRRGFVRIEETLRQALARAEAAVFDSRGSLQISHAGSSSLLSLVEREAQIKAGTAFRALRQRMAEGATESPRLTKAMGATLRPYQEAGVVWMTRLAHWGAGAILADEMGLGKTVQTLAVLAHRAARGPALVVAPTSVVPNWLAEAQGFTPELNFQLLRGDQRASLARGIHGLGAGDVLVTSYAVATLEAESLARVHFASLVIDEAQAVKNATTERAKALRDLDADWRLGLTGTPIENRLGELWSIMRVLSPGLLGSWEQFRARYAVPIEKFGDESRRKGLAELLRPFVLRRTKEEVARDLPPRTELIRSVRLSTSEQALYDELRASTLQEIVETKRNREKDGQNMRFVLLAALTRLRQLCCHPRLVYPQTAAGSTKADVLTELLLELRAEHHQVLVFSQFRSFLELLVPRLQQHELRVLVLDGTTPSHVREQRIQAFQRGEADVFLISLKAGGFGLNLTAADTVIHLDPWWNPAVEDQATARAHRIGQDKPVTAIRLVARGTIEESVLGLHAAKRALASGILEGAEVAASLDTDELIALIEQGAAPLPSG